MDGLTYGGVVWSAVLAQEGGVAPGVAGRSGAQAAPGGEAGQTAMDPNAQGSGTQQAPPPGGGGSGFLVIMVVMIGFLILMTFMSGRAQKKQQRERAAMLDGLRKHDKVLTRGGMIGRIVELRSDELVLKLDEATGTRATFSRSGIESVLRASGARDDGDELVDEEDESHELVDAGEGR